MTHARCDVLVIGAGPAGIAAAARAAEAGAKTLVVDEGLRPGGQIWRAGHGVRRSASSTRWLDRLSRSGAAVRSAASVVDVDARGSRFDVTADVNGEAFAIDAGALVLATGARELFLPFPGWTLPNVIGVGGAQALVKSGMRVQGKRVVVGGTGPLLLAVAASLSAHGARVQIVAEQAPLARVTRFAAGLWRTPFRAGQALAFRTRLLGTSYTMGTWVSSAEGRAGVEAVTLKNEQSTRTIGCDILCAAFGLIPNTELARFIGCGVDERGVQVDDTQSTDVPGVFCAGEPTGIGGVELSLVEGEIAGAAAAGASASAHLAAARARLRAESEALATAFALRPEILSLAREDTIVCRCEDVRLGELDRTWTPRQAKLYTRVGMGPCQGRICGGALECLLGWQREIPRPPIQPTRVATLAGAMASDARST